MDYNKDLIEESISFQNPEVYVFNNHPTMVKAQQYYDENKDILAKDSLFVMKEDLWNRLFITAKTIIKEDKANLIFYSLLNESHREFFNVDNYFDVIDTAVEFFHFYDFINKNMIDLDQLDLNVRWQQERLNKFRDIRERYKNQLKDLGLIDKVLKRDFTYFNTDYIETFEKINFVNILYFNRFDKKLIEKIEKKNKLVEIHIQINKKDYDQDKLRIKSFAFSDIDIDKINIYSNRDKLVQFVNVLSKIEDGKKTTEIIDWNHEENSFEKIISKDLIKFDNKPSFTETDIFQYLKELYNNLSRFKILNNNYHLDLNQLLKSTHTKPFKSYYSLEENDLKILKERSKDEYVYLDQLSINNICNNKIDKIIEDLRVLKKTKNMGQLIDFFKNIKVENLKENKYKGNDLEQYFDSLLELETIGLLEMDNYLKIDQDFADQLLKLVINYMEFKKVKIKAEKDNIKAEVKKIEQAAYKNKDLLVMINVNQGNIPIDYDNDTFLTDSDLKRLGLDLKEINYLKQKYNFFNHIFSSNQVDLFYLENVDNNTTGSSFIEELKIEYDIKENEPIFLANDQKEIINEIFKIDELKGYKDQLNSEIFKEDQMEMDVELDIPNKKISMGYYKHESLKRCPFKFFMEHMIDIEEENYDLEKELGLRMIGIIAHKFFEEVIEKYGLPIDNQYKDKIKSILKDILERYNLHIHNYFKIYYHDILFKSLVDSIFELERSIKSRIGKIDHIETEVSLRQRDIYKSQDEVKIYISGRPDLLIEKKDKSNYIVDLKTGKGSMEQLALYSLILNYDKRDFSKTSKTIYKIMDRQLQISNKDIEEKLEEEIIKELDNLFKEKVYKRIYKSDCKRCSYYDICRVVVK